MKTLQEELREDGDWSNIRTLRLKAATALDTLEAEVARLREGVVHVATEELLAVADALIVDLIRQRGKSDENPKTSALVGQYSYARRKRSEAYSSAPVSRPQTQDATLSDIARAFNAWTPPTASKEDVVIAIARALERAEKSPSGYIPAMIANDLQAAGLLSTERERGLEEADWQAIETAPKDGRDVILKMPFGVNGIRAFWCDDLKRWVLRFPLNVESILHPAGWRQADRSLKRSQEKG